MSIATGVSQIDFWRTMPQPVSAAKTAAETQEKAKEGGEGGARIDEGCSCRSTRFHRPRDR